LADLNPHSLEVLTNAMVEPAVAEARGEEPMQFERQGYFRRDGSSSSGAPILIRTVGLRDTFAKTLAEGKSQP
jgi:glutaminyl-tRNA synthetase